MYDIIVGIPSLNEDETISFVTRQVDDGLQKYYPDKKAVIANVDGGSTDNTKGEFLNTKTKTEKVHLCREGVKGKGKQFRMLFEFIKENKAKAVMVVDSDLKSIRPGWVKLMLDPVFRGYDFCTPFYSRHKYDGTITDHIVYPLVYGLFGTDIRQPIGGEFSFSGKMAEHWLGQEMYESTGQFGIDNFMTTSSITGGFRIYQVGLGAKVHKASGPNLKKMFIEVIDTLFRNTLKSGDFIKGVSEVRNISMSGIKLEKPQDLDVNKEDIRKRADDGMKRFESIYREIIPAGAYANIMKGLTPEEWCTIVYSFLNNFEKKGSRDYIEAFSHLYFARLHAFMEETWHMSKEEAEDKVKEQARTFFEKRSCFLDTIENFK